MTTKVKGLGEILNEGTSIPEAPWQLRVFISDECLSYMAWNEKTREALVIDPKDEDLEAYRTQAIALTGYLWLAVIDTHTHADHISTASALSLELKAPYLMHHLSPSTRVDFRVAQETFLPSHSGPVRMIPTPGHTQDAMSVTWGPYVFTGDTVVFGDIGRDDLPGGSAARHFESIEKLKKAIAPEMILLAGHDSQGGRASNWAKQLEINPSLSQSLENFVRESDAYDAPAPALMKKSLKVNCS